MSAAHQLLDEGDVGRTLVRMAHEILERNPDPSTIALVGIHTRGAYVAQRLRRTISRIAGVDVPLGFLDITFHRDDMAAREGDAGREQPIVRETNITFDVGGSTVVLCDDVLYTGRTIRSAIDALLEFGRPACVQLAVLVDRGHRELPIRPDFVGKNVPTAPGQWVRVEMFEVDEVDRVMLDPGPDTLPHSPPDEAHDSARVHRNRAAIIAG